MKKLSHKQIIALFGLAIFLSSCSQRALSPLITISIINKFQDCEEQNLNYTIESVQESAFRYLEGKIILPVFAKDLENKANNELFFPAESKHRIRIKVKGYYLYRQNGLNSFEECTSAHHFKVTEIVSVENVDELYDYPISAHYTPPSTKKIDYCTCDHLDLSKIFDVQLKVTKFKRFDGYQDSCLVKVVLLSKHTLKCVDSFAFSTIMFLDDSYEDCEQVLSYSTGKNTDREIVDDMYGDIVVADLNFDGLEDLAVMSEDQNAGTYYRFFLQGPKQKFKENQFLSDSIASFPDKINPRNKTLFTLSRAGACAVAEHTFMLKENGRWRTKSKKIIDHCKD